MLFYDGGLFRLYFSTGTADSKSQQPQRMDYVRVYRFALTNSIDIESG